MARPRFHASAEILVIRYIIGLHKSYLIMLCIYVLYVIIFINYLHDMHIHTYYICGGFGKLKLINKLKKS